MAPAESYGINHLHGVDAVGNPAGVDRRFAANRFQCIPPGDSLLIVDGLYAFVPFCNPFGRRCPVPGQGLGQQGHSHHGVNPGRLWKCHQKMLSSKMERSGVFSEETILARGAKHGAAHILTSTPLLLSDKLLQCGILSIAFRN